MAGRPTALVTGSSSGIGLAIAKELAREGYHVFASARDSAKLSRVRSEEPPFYFEPLALDVTDPESIRRAAEAITAAVGGPPDVLVNNAGYGLLGALEDLSLDELRAQFETNFFGVHAVTRAFLPAMRRRGSGTIVNISSLAGKVAVPLQGAYCASKFALEAYSDALRLEVAPFGIRVIVIEPGPVATAFGRTALKESARILGLEGSAYGSLYERFRRRFEGLGRAAAKPEDVARVVARALRSRRPRLRYQVRAREAVTARLIKLVPDRVIQWGARKWARI